MKKTSILLFLLFTYISSSQELKIKGVVFNEDNKPLSNILIITFTDKKNNLTYQYTNKKGEFVLLLKKENAPIFIKATSLFFKEQIKKVDVIKNQSIHFNLVPKTEELDEVVITATKVNRDTVNLGIQKYNIKKTESIEKSLKKIPGISIDKQGRIKYWDKEIEKILIDGDDLANKQYTFISKNLRSEVLEDIQVLKNFEENTVFKSSRNSEKIALNLKIKQKFKNSWFGNISLGYGNGVKSGSKLKETFNLGILKKSVKFLDFVKYSSLGEKSSPTFLEDSDTAIKNNFIYVVKKEEIFLPATITNFNTYTSNTFLVNKKFKKVVFRSTNFVGVDKQEQESFRETNYFLQPISFIENTKYNDKRILFFGDITLQPKGKKNNYFSNTLNYKINSNKLSSITNFNSNKISDNNKNKEYSFYNKAQYTHRFFNGIIVNNRINFGGFKTKETTIINSPFLISFLKKGSDTQQYVDKNTRFFTIKTDASYILSKGVKTNLFFGFKKSKENYNIELLPINKLYQNNIGFSNRDFTIKPSIIYKISNKVKLKGAFSTHFVKLNNIKSTLLNYSFIADMRFWGDLEISYHQKEEYPKTTFFLSNYFLINNNTFKKGSPFIAPLKYNLFKIKLNKYNNSRSFNNEVFFVYKKINSLLVNSYLFSDNINFNETLFSDKKGEDFLFKNQLVFLIGKLGVKLETSQLFSSLPIDVTEDAKSNLYRGGYKVELSSYFNSLNFKMELEYTKNTQKYKNNTSSFEAKNFLLDVDWDINKKMNLNINGGVYEVGNKYYKISTVQVNYVPEKSNFSYNFSINNLLNEDEFTFQERNSFFFYKQTIPLIPLYAFASVKYIF